MEKQNTLAQKSYTITIPHSRLDAILNSSIGLLHTHSYIYKKMELFYQEHLTALEGVKSVTFKGAHRSTGRPLTLIYASSVDVELIRATVDYLTDTFTTLAKKSSMLPPLQEILKTVSLRNHANTRSE